MGARVVPGSSYGAFATHYSISRLICDVFALPAMGYGTLEPQITGVWTAPVPTRESSWGGLKTIYR